MQNFFGQDFKKINKNSVTSFMNVPKTQNILHYSAQALNLLVNVLRQPNVGNAGRFVTQQVDMWIKDRRIYGLTILSQHCEDKINYTNECLSLISNYRFQSRIYGNPFLPPGCLAIPAQMRLNVDHIFYCKSIWAEENRFN